MATVEGARARAHRNGKPVERRGRKGTGLPPRAPPAADMAAGPPKRDPARSQPSAARQRRWTAIARSIAIQRLARGLKSSEVAVGSRARHRVPARTGACARTTPPPSPVPASRPRARLGHAYGTSTSLVVLAGPLAYLRFHGTGERYQGAYGAGRAARWGGGSTVGARAASMSMRTSTTTSEDTRPRDAQALIDAVSRRTTDEQGGLSVRFPLPKEEPKGRHLCRGLIGIGNLPAGWQR